MSSMNESPEELEYLDTFARRNFELIREQFPNRDERFLRKLQDFLSFEFLDGFVDIRLAAGLELLDAKEVIKCEEVTRILEDDEIASLSPEELGQWHDAYFGLFITNPKLLHPVVFKSIEALAQFDLDITTPLNSESMTRLMNSTSEKLAAKCEAEYQAVKMKIEKDFEEQFGESMDSMIERLADEKPTIN